MVAELNKKNEEIKIAVWEEVNKAMYFLII